jgi:hypothetical protein
MDWLLVTSVRRKHRALRYRTPRLNRVDSCGCAMGARFLAAALLLSTLWYTLRWHSSGLSIKAVLIRISVISFLSAGVGKVIGIVASKRRTRVLFIKR